MEAATHRDPPDAETPDQAPVLEVVGLCTWFDTPAGIARAVDDVDLEVRPGEVVAIVGESGSGKSVTALSILKLVQVPPGRYEGGEVRIAGRNVLTLDERSLEEVRGAQVSMIFQNPRASLDPSFSIGNQITEVLLRHEPALDAAEAGRRAGAALREAGFAEAQRVLESYPHQLSGGMCQRVALAMALGSNPELLIADEPTTALDVGVQAKILLLLKRKNRELGLPILIITHDFGVVRAIASRVVVMYAGQVQEVAPVDALLEEPHHPYTRALIESVPDPDSEGPAFRAIPGEPPNLLDVPPGCRFSPRCPRGFDRCRVEMPVLQRQPGGRQVRCHLYDPTERESHDDAAR